MLACGAAAFLTYMVIRVPVVAPRLPGSEAHRHWPVAIGAALLVALYDASVVSITRRRRRQAVLAHLGRFDETQADVTAAPPGGTRRRLPEPLGWERVPRDALAASAILSAALASGALIGGYALWVIALGAIVPWLPALAWEGVSKYRRYGFYAFFYAVVLFQLAHMGEHSVQVLQLLLTHGDLARAHGVFGQLDFELVHFVFDGTVWLALGVLVCVFRGQNRWLWVALAAASLHEVEHLYVFWLHLAHPSFYALGGFEGIMGSGGLIGSPLARPYLHFAYNLIVVVPMVVALYDQSRRISDRDRGRVPPMARAARTVRGTARTTPLSLSPRTHRASLVLGTDPLVLRAGPCSRQESNLRHTV
jgi:hypothetical protein